MRERGEEKYIESIIHTRILLMDGKKACAGLIDRPKTSQGMLMNRGIKEKDSFFFLKRFLLKFSLGKCQ